MPPDPIRAAAVEPAVPAHPSFLASGRIGPYQLHDVLGEGGMGIVFRATPRQGGQPVALKMVNRLTRRRMLALREETVALRAVQHPGIVRILDQGSHDGIPWYVMELLTGKTLAHYNDQLWDSNLDVTRSGVSRSVWTDAGEATEPVSESRDLPSEAVAAGGGLEGALRLYRDLCAPLGHIHARGMVHRDLKPQNVFIRTDGYPVLMDFGLIGYASGAIGREVLEAGNQGFGTVHYVSPERIDGRQVDARADLYSLGCMLYETLVGRPPFVGEPGHVLSQHLSATPLAPSQILHGVPPVLDQLILQLLAKTPQARVGHAGDVAATLAQILDEESVPSLESEAVPLFRPGLSGREEVLAQLASALDRALQRQGRLLLVGGESGIGKTFLTSELAHSAVKRGFRVVTGGANQFSPNADLHAGESVGPFQALRSVLQTIADGCREAGPEERERILGRRALYLAPFEPGLEAFVEFEASSQPDTLPGAANLERIKTALAETLHAYASSGPLLIIVDDVQWADQLSISFLAALDRSFFDGLPLVIVCAHRNEHAHSAIDALRASDVCTAFSLEKLGDVAVHRMVADMLSSEPPPDLVTFLVRESRGNPFFVAEYLRFLVAGKHLVRTDGRWLVSDSVDAVTDYGALQMPDRLEQLLAWRLQALSERAQRAIEAGAVLGGTFNLDVLARLLDEAEERLLELMREARERLVLEDAGLHAYRFRHDKLREVTYAALAPSARRALHARAARAMEASQADESSASRSRELAFHYELGGEPRSALVHFVRAGEEALAKAGLHEAIEHFRSALRLEATLDGIADADKARWLRMLGGALHDVGDYAQGNRYLERALELLGERCPRHRRRPLAVLILTEVARQARSRLWPRQQQVAPEVAENTLQRAKIHGRIQEAAYYTDDPLPMLYSCLRMLNLGEQAPPSPSLTVAYANAQAVAGIIPSAPLAARYTALARQNMAAAPSALSRAHLCLITAGYATGRADWPSALAAVDEGLDACAAIDYAQRSRDLSAAESSARYLAADFGAARAAAERVYAQATGKDAHSHCWALLLEAQVLLVEGKLHASLERLQGTRPLLQTLGRPERIWSRSLEAFVCAKLANPSGAERASDAALGDIVGAPLMNYFVVDSVARCAEVRLWLCRVGGKTRKAERTARQALQALQAMKRAFPIAEPRLLFLQAQLHRMRSDPRRASRALLASASLSRRLAMPYDEARALLARSALEPAARAAASSILERLGADVHAAEPL